MKIAQKRNNVVKESKLPNIKLLNEVCCSLSTFCTCKKVWTIINNCCWWALRVWNKYHYKYVYYVPFSISLLWYVENPVC